MTFLHGKGHANYAVQVADLLARASSLLASYVKIVRDRPNSSCDQVAVQTCSELEFGLSRASRSATGSATWIA